ncbi:ornithine cyclodeaminase family protein [Polymorphospora rubra]|uniref:ornithine cyclodeaminase family protein n=1 Tax=Polymorphospora rubra TaxID=338584 RepID=UPI0033CA66BC
MVLTRSRIDALIDIGNVLALLREGFRASTASPAPLRIRTDLPGPGTATCLMPGLLPGVPAYTVKVNAKFPDAIPALRGVVCLHDLHTGELLALADSASLTAWRTGLAAALATHTLAHPDADTLGFIGAGAQARTTLAGLRHLRSWRHTSAYDLNPARARELTPHLAGDARAVAAHSDVVVLATWSRQPVLHGSDTHAGQHLTSLGADEPGKNELSTDLLRSARVIVDDLDLACAAGALGNAGLDADAAAGTLTDVLRGDLPAHDQSRASVYVPVGLPWQDLALLWWLHQHATATQVTTIDLLS